MVEYGDMNQFSSIGKMMVDDPDNFIILFDGLSLRNKFGVLLYIIDYVDYEGFEVFLREYFTKYLESIRWTEYEESDSDFLDSVCETHIARFPNQRVESLGDEEEDIERFKYLLLW